MDVFKKEDILLADEIEDVLQKLVKVMGVTAIFSYGLKVFLVGIFCLLLRIE